MWQTPVNESQDLSRPVADGAAVYVGSNNGFLMALQAATGALLWKISPSTPSTSNVPTGYRPLAVVAGKLYVLSTGGLVRVNAVDGASARYPLPLPATTPLLDPQVVNGILYAGIEVTPDSRSLGRPDIVAYRLLASGGALLWRLPANGLELSMLAHDAQTLYLRELIYGSVYAVRLADGAIRWRHVAFGRWPLAAAADATTGDLIETVSGVVVVQPCNVGVEQAATIRASKSADGGVIWVRVLDATH